MSQPIKLYTFALSPFGVKVYWALRAKGLDFELIYVEPFRAPEIKFTGQIEVPVLAIGDDWKLDSTPIIRWLDERYPDTPLAGRNETERAKIGEMDDWVSHRFIPSFFRHTVNNRDLVASVPTGYTLARQMRDTSGLPLPLFWIWPIVLRTAGFIRHEVRKVRDFRTVEEMDEAMMSDLETYLADGPFMGGFEVPTLADVSAYAQIHSNIALPLRGALDFRTSDIVNQWMQRVETTLVHENAPALYEGMPESVMSGFTGARR